jgi:hypothetical protein
VLRRAQISPAEAEQVEVWINEESKFLWSP